jgi:sulfoxide reductase catalytic subunit YedY
MQNITPPRWALPDNLVTPQAVFLNRRQWLARAGLIAGAAALPSLPGLPALAAAPGDAWQPVPKTNPAYADAGRAVTPQDLNIRYSNFYEFGSHKEIFEASRALPTSPWTVKIGGMVERPFEIGVDELVAKMPIEERVYRHRCVEAWSMVVPWIGFPLPALVALARPLGSAKFVEFQTFQDPQVARGQRQFWYPWPYTEGLTIEEAGNDLAFMVVGAYGETLFTSMGAPIRLHLPWKYGFKSIKSVVSVNFTEERPVGFWETLQESEYGFWANVNPEVAHPRWSQASERVLGTDERVPTQLFNGYAEEVAHLYAAVDEGDRLWR